MNSTNSLIIRSLGQQDYLSCWQAMKQFTDARNNDTLDELWLLEHPPVYTQGQNGRPEHIFNPGNIPIIQTDRGGQVTYHGPGQLVAYTLIDLQRKAFNIRQLVTLLENTIIALLADYQIPAQGKREAPGIYVTDKKICSLGLRVRRGYVYHGLALNIAMDLKPFSQINPCGFANLQMTQLADFVDKPMDEIRQRLIKHLMTNLGYTNPLFQT